MTITDEATASSPLRRSLTAPLIGSAVFVVVDQLTKWWALNTLDDGHTIHLLSLIKFHYLYLK